MSQPTGLSVLHGSEGRANSQNHGPILRNSDASKAVKVGAAAGLAGAAYYIMLKMFQRNSNPSIDIKGIDLSDAFNQDNDIREAFIEIEFLRDYSESSFRAAIRSADQLIFMDHTFKNNEDLPVTSKDARDATAFHMKAKNSLFRLYQMCKKRKSAEEAHAVYTIIERIRNRLHIHLTNVYERSKNVDPKKMIQYMNTMSHKDRKRQKRKDFLDEFSAPTNVHRSEKRMSRRRNRRSKSRRTQLQPEDLVFKTIL